MNFDLKASFKKKTMSDYSLFEDALKEYENNKNIKDIDDNISNELSEDIICEHANITEENGFTCCSDCGIEMNKSIYQDKEWRYYGQSDNKRVSDPNRVHLRKMEERNIFKDVENMGFSDKIVYLNSILRI